MLTSGYQEYSLLSGILIANDASVAYDYDLGGAPALERVISGVEHKEYGFMALPEMGGLEETAALCRGLGRVETADRIDRLSRAVDANYRPIRPGTFLFVPRE